MGACCHILVWDGGLQNMTSLDSQATGRVGFFSPRASPSPTHLPCVRGMFVRVHERVCVWVCERMCGVGEVCVGVWAGVRGCEWCEWGRGSRDRQSTLTSLGSCTSFLLVNDPGRCDLTACDQKNKQNAWATYSSNQGPPLPANPRSLLEVTSYLSKHLHVWGQECILKTTKHVVSTHLAMFPGHAQYI